jgi:hypothetical protein
MYTIGEVASWKSRGIETWNRSGSLFKLMEVPLITAADKSSENAVRALQARV